MQAALPMLTGRIHSHHGSGDCDQDELFTDHQGILPPGITPLRYPSQEDRPNISGPIRSPHTLVVLLVLASCVQPSAGETASVTAQEDGMRLRSEAFGEGEAIPSVHSCDGEDRSPPLAWEDAPEGTAVFALIVDDPDARGFVHWVLVDIPGSEPGVAEGEGDSVGVPGRNDFGRIGWGGPCPPSGEHRYVFTLYALSAPLELTGTVDAASVRGALGDRVLAQAQLTGVYRRGG